MNVTVLSHRKFLFVSNGGICRAPMAVGVLKRLLQENRIARQVQLASAAICDIHVGMPPDPLAIAAAAACGYDIGEIRVRKVEIHDFHTMTMLAVDAVVLTALRNIAPHGMSDHPQLLPRYSGSGRNNIVDPYGGTITDHLIALNLIEASCRGLAAVLRARP
jgi:protein-tyrosine phosphatase